MAVAEVKNIVVVGRCHLVDASDDRLLAWAEHHVRVDSDIKWILGNYVEADHANGNGHIFPLAELETYGINTVANKPLNMLHHERYVIGAFAGAEMIYPTGQGPADREYAAADMIEHPVMEALSGMWHKFFADEYRIVERAHKEGTLFYSMECAPLAGVTCPECEKTTAWLGYNHASYCEHINASKNSPKRLNTAHFNAGALIIPPVQPGWSKADIKQLAQAVSDTAEAESLYAAFESSAPHLSSKVWEELMLTVVSAAHERRT